MILAFLMAIMVSLSSGVQQNDQTVKGWASNYAGTAGFMGRATVALPDYLGGHYTGRISGYALVCADRCVSLPIVDYCLCHVSAGLHPDRIVDLSYAAWKLVSDDPLTEGLIPVTVTVQQGDSEPKLPNTAFK